MTQLQDERENVLTGYCFLAALTEQQSDLYNHVFVPICKRALSLYSLTGGTHGKATDIKDIILNEYGIDVPIVMVKRLILSAAKSLSKSFEPTVNSKFLKTGDHLKSINTIFQTLNCSIRRDKGMLRQLNRHLLLI
jgi:hypothetical protein